MAAPSNYYPILQAAKTIIDGLNLTDWNGNPLPSAIRKLPAVEQEIDVLPLLAIVPKEDPPKRKCISFGPAYTEEYPCEIVAIAPDNRDFTSHLDWYLGWHFAITQAFKLPAPVKAIVPAVWDVNVRPDLVIDRAQVNDNYDYGGLTLEVSTLE